MSIVLRKNMSAKNAIIILTLIDSRKEDLIYWTKTKKQYVSDKVRKGIGFVFEQDKKIMIITCNHVIKNAAEIYGLKIIDNGMDIVKFELKSVVNAIEFDVGILKPTDETLLRDLFPNPHTINNFEMSLPQKNDNILLLEMSRTDDIFYKTNILDWSVKNITIEKIAGENVPENVLINVSPSNVYESGDSYNGMSGGPCFDSKNKIIGIVGLGEDDEIINIIPAMAIFRVIREYNKYMGACSLYFESKLITNDKFRDKKYVQITNNYSFTHKKNSSMLKNKDILLYISKNSINDDGYVFCPVLKYNIPIETYCMLNFVNSEIINIDVIRKNKKINLKIKAIPINKCCYVPLSISNKKFVEFNGMTFIEISEDIIEFFSTKKNIDIIGPFIEKKKYRKKKSKIVVLIDLVNKDVIEKINYRLFKNKYQIVRDSIIENKNAIKYVPTLLKINGKSINNISDICEKRYSNIELELETGNNMIIEF